MAPRPETHKAVVIFACCSLQTFRSRPRRPGPFRDLRTNGRLRERGARRRSALSCDSRGHRNIHLLQPPAPPPQPPERPVPFRDLRTNGRLRERGAWRHIALLCDLRTGDCCTPPTILQLPKIPIPSRNLRTSDRLRERGARWYVALPCGLRTDFADDASTTEEPRAFPRPPDGQTSEGVVSATRGYRRLRESVER